MKKVALSLAGLMAAAAFAPEASALPVFARQTGMACNACHFQHFPILNGFGRAFKASGFTLMGAQGKVEGDELSLPDRLNMAVLTTAGWENNTGGAAIGPKGPNAMIQAPGNGGELSLFFGGKISENAGFLSEFGASGAPGMSAAKLPMLYEVGAGIRAGLVVFTTAGQGPSYGFELLNTGASGIHMATPMPGVLTDHFAAASANRYVGIGSGAAVGATAVVVNPDMFFVNISKVAVENPAAIPAVLNVAGGAATGHLNANYVRAAYIFDVAGFNMAAGVQTIAGTDFTRVNRADARVVDFQMMGDMGSMTLLVTASVGSAPISKAGQGANMYNAGTVGRVSKNLHASLGITPHASVFAGFRRATDGAQDAITGKALTDNAVQIGGTYGLAQNVELSVTHTRQSGTAWVAPALVGQNGTSVKIEALF